MTRITIAALFALVVTSLFTSSAFAAGGGTVKGTLKFHNALIHYCPNISLGRNCTGSNYNENAWDTQLPISQMKVSMKVNGVTVGSGSTDVNGNYQFNWTYPHTGSPTNAQLEAFLEHKDGRFQVLKEDGSDYRIYANFTAYYDWIGSPLNPPGVIQNLGTWSWGSSGTPNPRLQMYHAAWRTWYYAFSYAGSLLNGFNTMEIWTGATSGGSFYDINNHRGVVNKADMDQFSYQVVYHEMGHAASQKSAVGGSWQFANRYNFPSTTAGGGHTYDTPEWSSASFEEGLVDFLGIVGHYWFNAPEARACLTISPNRVCANTVPADQGINLEQNPTCAGTNENRFQRNTTRFLWDYYDSNDEGSGDVFTEGYWHFLDANNDFLNSAGNNGKNEPWNTALTAIDDVDGRSLNDMRRMLTNKFGVSSATLYATHCSPPGSY